ncbi:hypothetical protein [Massilia sp. CF038]|uniref:hypothetical protein n=1 Tax=Massilia sp. CF038 TaxID=1881045 RepID=UPI00091ADF45|nr:hypothetical protein [Massilia sp. CF038]SHH21411.1 hypothetical protein SAMN05428948_3346 [Massilia sp. CF038]
MKNNAMRIAALMTLAASVLMTGCATTPTDTAAQPQENASKEYATGSRLPVRKPAAAAPADKI